MIVGEFHVLKGMHLATFIASTCAQPHTVLGGSTESVSVIVLASKLRTSSCPCMSCSNIHFNVSFTNIMYLQVLCMYIHIFAYLDNV